MKKLLLFLTFSFFATTIIHSEELMKININNFQIQVPLGWMAQYTQSPTVFILYSPVEENDTFQENCNLTVENLSTKYSINGYLKASIDSLKKIYTDLKVIEQKDNYLIISGELNGTALQQVFYVFIDNSKAYTLTFSSNPDNFSDYSKMFSKIASSFIFK